MSNEPEEISQVRDLRVRVHAPHYPHTFVVHIVAGIVDAVTAPEYRQLLGLPELDARDALKALGCKVFVDLNVGRSFFDGIPREQKVIARAKPRESK